MIKLMKVITKESCKSDVYIYLTTNFLDIINDNESPDEFLILPGISCLVKCKTKRNVFVKLTSDN